MTAGYSGTPLARKLGIVAGSGLALVDPPAGWSVPSLPAGVVDGTDVVLLFVRTSSALSSGVPAWAPRVFPASSLWVAWPRKAGGHVSDVSENLIRSVALPLGLVDVKVAALDADWSGLKLVWRKELRSNT